MSFVKIPISDNKVTSELIPSERKVEVTTKLEECLKWIPHPGLSLMLFASLFLSLASVCMKKAKIMFNISPMQCIGTSYLMVTVFQLLLLLIKKCPLKGAPGENLSLTLRCAFGGIAGLTTFVSISMMPMGDATAIHSTAPVYVSLLAICILKEKIKVIYVVLLLVNIFGVLLISKPAFLFPGDKLETEEDSFHYLLAVIIANFAAVSTALGLVFLRKLKNTSTDVAVLWLSFSIFTIGYLHAFILGELEVSLEAMPLITGGFLCALAAHQLQTIAFRFEKAGLLSMVRSSGIFFSYANQIVFFNESLDLWKTFGAVIVLTTILTIGIDKMKEAKNVESLK